MAEPEYFVKGEKVPNLADTVCIVITKDGFMRQRSKKSGQMLVYVPVSRLSDLIEEYRNNIYAKRLFVKGTDETPELRSRAIQFQQEMQQELSEKLKLVLTPDRHR